jgi:hypothetical protein
LGDCGAGGFVERARYTVADAPTWTRPVVVGDSLLIRDGASLALWSAR